MSADSETTVHSASADGGTTRKIMIMTSYPSMTSLGLMVWYAQDELPISDYLFDLPISENQPNYWYRKFELPDLPILEISDIGKSIFRYR